MPAVKDVQLSVQTREKSLVVRVEATVVISALEECLYKLCPDAFNQEYIVGAVIKPVDFGIVLDTLILLFQRQRLELEAGQTEKRMFFEKQVALRAELNEDPFPGNADEIVAMVEIRTALNGAFVSNSQSDVVTGLF